jgi:hypothetical protein
MAVLVGGAVAMWVLAQKAGSFGWHEGMIWYVKSGTPA